MPTLFALLDAIFNEQQKGVVEDLYGRLESDAVLLAIGAALLLVPLLPHRYTYRITATTQSQIPDEKRGCRRLDFQGLCDGGPHAPVVKANPHRQNAPTPSHFGRGGGLSRNAAVSPPGARIGL